MSPLTHTEPILYTMQYISRLPSLNDNLGLDVISHYLKPYSIRCIIINFLSPSIDSIKEGVVEVELVQA